MKSMGPVPRTAFCLSDGLAKTKRPRASLAGRNPCNRAIVPGTDDELIRSRCSAVRRSAWSWSRPSCSASRRRAVEQPAAGPASGLPVPRFVSLKSDRVNVRGGPTRDHDVTWIFTRSGLPVEVTAEFDNWRRIRDWEGVEGWVYHSLLSGRRTALVAATPKHKDELLPLHSGAEAKAAVIARLQPGVVGR